MISKITLTTILLAFVIMASAQSTSKRSQELFKGKTPSALERGLETRENLRPYVEAMKQGPLSSVAMAKSASSFTARLDSVIVDEDIKINFAYDANGNTTMELVSFWEGPELWLPFDKIETVYNDEDLPIEITYSSFEFMTDVPIPNYREIFTYNEENQVFELTTELWLELENEWFIQNKRSYTYDGQGNVLEITTSLFEDMSETFFPVELESNTYNATGGLIETITYNWNGTDWVNSTRLSFTLNDDNLVLTEEFSFWLAGDSEWLVLVSNTHTYNAAGLEAEVIYTQWNEDEEVFIPDAKDVKAYDDMDRLTSEEFYFWNVVDSLWDPSYLDLFDYDAAGNLVLSTYLGWDEDAAEYVIDGTEASTFNNDYAAEDIMAPEGYSEFFQHMILSSTYTSTVVGDEFEENTEYYYTFFDLVSVKDESKNPFSVYPNPFRESIRLSGAEEMQRFTLYDLQGRVLLQKQLAGAREVNPDHLPAGVYVYQIDGANTRQTGKLVKE